VLPGRVSFEKSTAYDLSLLSYWAGQETQLHPACIVNALTTDDDRARAYSTVPGCPSSVCSAVWRIVHLGWSGDEPQRLKFNQNQPRKADSHSWYRHKIGRRIQGSRPAEAQGVERTFGGC
jgi:hypothetical protein